MIADLTRCVARARGIWRTIGAPCSTAGGKDKRVVVVNGIALPKCRRGGGGGRKGFILGFWAVRTMHVRVCRGGELGRGNGTPLFFPIGVGQRGRRTGSKDNEGSAAVAIGAPWNTKRSAAAAGLGAMRTQPRELAKGSDEESNDAAVGEVFFRACVLGHFFVH
jgi:hypothetical protein